MAGEMRTCSKCGSEYPATSDFFYWRKDRGLQKVCKKCHIAKVDETCRDWQRNNHGLVLGYQKKYRETHRGRAHDYYEAHRDEYAERSRRYQRERPESYREYSRRWRERHRDRVRAQWADWYDRNRDYEMVRQQNKRARRVSATGSFTEDDVRFIYDYQRGRCFYCLDPVGDDFHRDHFVPLARGGTNDWTNIVVSCPTCNLSKRDKFPGDFLAEQKGEPYGLRP